MAEVETSLETSVTTKTTETVEETTTTTVEVNGCDHNNSEKEVDKVTISSEECVNGTSKVTENGEAKAETTEESSEPEAEAVPEGEADKVEPEKKEEVIPKVILHQFPPGKDIPSLSLFCLKLETFLRLNKIPYENQYGFKLGKKGKLPWIEYQGERKTDSNLIIDYLTEKFDVHIDDELTDEQHAIGRAVQAMIEENSYWGLTYNRFIDNYNEYKRILAPTTGGGIGFNVGVKMTQRKVRTSLEGQGLGRHSKEEIYAIIEKDLKSVSAILGEKQYLLGDKVSIVDCTVFSFFANVLWCGLDSPMSQYVKENATNLVAYCDRIKDECWPDWAEMVLGDKPEPALKKGFSFRKKRAKPKKEKEEKAEEEEKKEEKSEEETTENAEEKKDEEKPEEKKESEEQTSEKNTGDKPAEPVAEEKSTETQSETKESESKEPPAESSEGAEKSEPEKEST